MDGGVEQKIAELDSKLTAIWQSVEKTRRYFQITMWVTIIFFVVPLVLLAFVIPLFLNSYLGPINDMDSSYSSSLDQLEALNDLLR